MVFSEIIYWIAMETCVAPYEPIHSLLIQLQPSWCKSKCGYKIPDQHLGQLSNSSSPENGRTSMRGTDMGDICSTHAPKSYQRVFIPRWS